MKPFDSKAVTALKNRLFQFLSISFPTWHPVCFIESVRAIERRQKAKQTMNSRLSKDKAKEKTMKTITRLFMVMVMAFALVSMVGTAGAAINDHECGISGPAFTDYVNSRDLPFKSCPTDL